MYKIKLTKLGIVDEPHIEEAMQYVKEGEERVLITSSKPTVEQALYASYENRFRFFNTSVVKEIVSETDNKIVFKTMNSIYEYEILEELDPAKY